MNPIADPAEVNDVLDTFRVSTAARTSDLFPWVPEERYDVIVASLDQMRVDPCEQVSTAPAV